MTEFLVITGGTIIDGRGGKPIKDGVLVIKGRRITAVGDAFTPVPKSASRIDARGKFLIPGLMDASVHLVGDTFPLTLIRHEGRYDELALEAAQIALKAGVTTVFDSWGPRTFLIKARDAINDGRQVGARVYLSGNIVGYGGPYSDDFYPNLKAGLFGYANNLNAMWEEGVGPNILRMTPDDLRSAIRQHVENGIDFLRYAVNPLNPLGPPYLLFSPRMQRILVEEGHRAGIIVQSYGSSAEGLHLAMDAGVDVLSRPEITGLKQPLPPDTIDSIVERRLPCAIYAVPDEGRAWMTPSNPWIEMAGRNQLALMRAGATMLLLTDGGVLSSDTKAVSMEICQPPPPYESLLYDVGVGHFNWLSGAEQMGMKPMDALLAATRNIAQAYRVDKNLGTLEAGKIADVIILDKDPLKAAANYRSIADVIKEGKVVDRNALPSTRLLTALPA